MSKLPFVWELNNEGVISHAVGSIHCVENIYSQNAKKLLEGKKHLLTEARTEDATIQEQLDIGNIKLGSSIEKLTQKEKSDLEYYTDTPLETLIELPVGVIPAYLLQRSGYRNLTSMEQIFEDASHVRPKALEKIDFKIATDQLKDCTESLRTLIAVVPPTRGSAIQFFQTLYTAYKEGNAQKIARLSELDDEKELTQERNKTMVNNSLAYIKQPSIVLAGAAHFVCEPSMLTLYQEKGIKVKRVQ